MTIDRVICLEVVKFRQSKEGSYEIKEDHDFVKRMGKGTEKRMEMERKRNEGGTEQSFAEKERGRNENVIY